MMFEISGTFWLLEFDYYTYGTESWASFYVLFIEPIYETSLAALATGDV